MEGHASMDVRKTPCVGSSDTVNSCSAFFGYCALPQRLRDGWSGYEMQHFLRTIKATFAFVSHSRSHVGTL